MALKNLFPAVLNASASAVGAGGGGGEGFLVGICTLCGGGTGLASPFGAPFVDGWVTGLIGGGEDEKTEPKPSWSISIGVRDESLLVDMADNLLSCSGGKFSG